MLPGPFRSVTVEAVRDQERLRPVTFGFDIDNAVNLGVGQLEQQAFRTREMTENAGP